MTIVNPDLQGSAQVDFTVKIIGPAPKPDLVVEAPSVSANPLTPGQTFTLSATVRNQGAEASSSTTLRYYRSIDAIITRQDTQLDTDRVSKLIPSSTVTASANLTAPSTAGTYYYGVCVDSVTDEADISNNCSSGIRVTVEESTKPDITSVSDTSATEGDMLTFTVRLSRSTTQTETYYYSTYGVTARPGDYDGAYEGEVRVASGRSSFTIQISTNQDAHTEPDETFYLYVTEERNHPSSTPGPSRYRGTGTIYEEDEVAPTDDGAVLVALYNATRGAGWTRKANWLSDTPLSQWYGVTTDSNGRVIELNLFENALSGSIPPKLGQLTNLRFLGLDDNNLSGSIPPELGQLTNLEALNLVGNNLSGSIPPELGQLTNLEWLHLFENQLSGSIPPELGRLANLRFLGLYGNQLSGSIPPELGRLANLEWLSLGENQLSGRIPPELGRLTNLEVLGLDGNQLSGSIPPELGRLANLEWLSLGENQLSGRIPPELGRLTNLEWLDLRGNMLTGCIPSELRGVPENNLDELGLPFC